MKTVITVPSGHCPYSLEGTDRDSIVGWMKKIKEWSPDGVVYTPSALRYWIRHSYDINGLEYKIAAQVFDSLLDD